MKPTPHLVASSLITLLLYLTSTTTVTAEELDQKTFSIGVVPQFDARKIHKIWAPILKELEKSTGYRFKLMGAPTIPEFEKEFNAGHFDFAYMNPYHVLLANKHQGYVPLVRDVGRRLHGVLTVKKDSPISSPAELDGKIISFPAPNALGASLMIQADLQDIFNIKIKPRHVKTHSSVYLNVALGVSSAGGGVQKTLNQQPVEIRDTLRVLYKTRDVAPHPFSAHPRVPQKITAQVKKLLLELGNTPHGQALLKNIPIKKIGNSSMEDYRPLNEIGLERFYAE